MSGGAHVEGEEWGVRAPCPCSMTAGGGRDETRLPESTAHTLVHVRGTDGRASKRRA